MYVRKRRWGWVARPATVVAVVLLSGCGLDLLPDESIGGRTTLNLETLGLASETTYYETAPNDEFELAEFVPTFDESRVIRGEISGPNDVDVYDLGPVFPGDHVTVSLTVAASLDAALALFDEYGDSFLINDHRNVYLGRAEPFIDLVVQRESQACFVAVSSTPGFSGSGSYAMVTSVTGNDTPPPLRPDEILLIFNGGQGVRIGGRAPVDVPAFDAFSIDPVYGGETDLVVDEIVYRIREDYAAADVTILSTSEGDSYELGMTRIYFGTFDAALLGVAEGVDEFNATRSQTAIVFTDTFEAFMRLDPSPVQLGQALANVASHEIGHLLGLIHTRDVEGIMDVTASLSALMRDQSFSRSEVYSAVFPVGFQNAGQYLIETVGGDAQLMFEKVFRPRERMLEPSMGPSARTELRLSTCCLLGR